MFSELISLNDFEKFKNSFSNASNISVLNTPNISSIFEYVCPNLNGS